MNKTTEPSALSKDNVQKTDLRVIKTKRAILNALIELLQKKCIDKITVTELAHKAEINKGTFYLHYSDMHDLYQFALKEHFRKIVDQIDFMELFITDPAKFSRNLVLQSFNNPIFESDPFFSEENASFNQGAQLYFCNALTSKVLESTTIPATLDNMIKLKFIFSGAGSLLRYDSQKDAEVIISTISDTIKNLFPESNNEI